MSDRNKSPSRKSAGAQSLWRKRLAQLSYTLINCLNWLAYLICLGKVPAKNQNFQSDSDKKKKISWKSWWLDAARCTLFIIWPVLLPPCNCSGRHYRLIFKAAHRVLMNTSRISPSTSNYQVLLLLMLILLVQNPCLWKNPGD